MSRLTFNTNILSLNAQRRLTEHTSNISQNFERLSTGLRINKASDDAAGLAISSLLDAETRIANQGIRNLNDGISLISIASGATEELTKIVTRLTELSAQAANGTFSSSQRNSLNIEAQSLSKEFNRIARTTTFNNQNLFDIDFGELSLAAGGGKENLLIGELGGSIGDGTFESDGTYNGISVIHRVNTADLNGDGNQDIITNANSGANNIAVNLGNGDGTFKSRMSFANGITNATSVQAVDVNGDSILDLVSTGNFDVSIMLGNGNGTFKAATLLGASGYIYDSLKIGDINNDGNVDLVMTAGLGQISTILGNGDGSFGNEALYTIGGSVTDVELGDFNNDGNTDVVVGNFATTTVNVLYGSSDGSLSTAQVINLGGQNNGNVYVADFNNDGNADIFASRDLNRSAYSLILGNGDGTYRSAMNVDTGLANTFGILTSDLDGDGNIDFALQDSSTNELKTYLGNGDGTFSLGEASSMSSPSRFIAEDLNHDGLKDIISAERSAGSGLEILLGQGGSGIAALDSFSLTHQIYAREALDYFKTRLNSLATQRATIGALESRISFSISNIKQQSTALRDANSRIEDVDVAEESTRLIRSKILQEATQTILVQANQQPTLVLSLLGDL